MTGGEEAYEKHLLVYAYERQVAQLGEHEAKKWVRLCHPQYAEAFLESLQATSPTTGQPPTCPL
jgi:hypothetical protein